MKITRIGRHPRRDRARIHFDGEEHPRLELAVDLLVRSGLAVGDELDQARLAALEADDQHHRAREAAIRLLAHRPRSAAELRGRLERRAVPGGVIDATLGWLSERGYLDDRAFAESFVRDRLRLRPGGRVGLVQELRRRGVAAELASAATDAVMASEGVVETDLAARAARAWARRNGPLVRQAAGDAEARRRARRRLNGHLARRGFDATAVRGAMDTVLGD